jgi:hypothetical protein
VRIFRRWVSFCGCLFFRLFFFLNLVVAFCWTRIAGLVMLENGEIMVYLQQELGVKRS